MEEATRAPEIGILVDREVYPLGESIPYFPSKTLEKDNAGFDLRVCSMKHMPTGYECGINKRLPLISPHRLEGEDTPDSGFFYMEPLTPYIMNTGVKMSIPKGFYGDVCLRSSSKKYLAMPDHGTIDCNYRGFIKVVAFSYSVLWVAQFSRISQIKIVPYLKDYTFVSGELEETTRGASGFGEYTS